MKADKWLDERLAYIRGLKAPSEQQRLLLTLAEMTEIDAKNQRKLNALVRAEKAAERAQKAKADAARIVNAEKAAQRKARDHELYNSAGLLIMAGLVDSKTGTPTRDKGELLGALIAMAEADISPERRAEWKKTGDQALSQGNKQTKEQVKDEQEN